jgi:phosphatidate cytidylyltransferase
MTNLTTRVVTAVVLVAVLLAALLLMPDPAAEGLFALVFMIAGWEWSGFIKGAGRGIRLAFVASLAVLAVAPVVFFSIAEVAHLFIYTGVICWVLFTLVLVLKLSIAGTLLVAVAGMLTLLPAWYATLMLLSLPEGAHYFLWCVGIVAAADIGAYFIGRRFGRRKLAPSISPGKTLEGFFGGVIAASVFTAVFAQANGQNGLYYLLPGCLVAAISVIGDLWISRFKRAAGLKDSGRILPGHGGVLDRIDSLLAALPIFVVIGLWMGHFSL